METSTTDGQTTDNNEASENQNQEKVTVQNPEGVLNKNRELLGVNKKLSGDLSTLREELENHRQDKQISEGKKDEVITSLREENRKLKTNLQDTTDSYNWNTVESQLKSAAAKVGCVDPDKLVKLIDDKELSSLEVDSKYRVNTEDLNSFVTKIKKENSFLFTESSANIDDLNPSSTIKKKVVKDVSSMSKEEIEAELRKLG